MNIICITHADFETPGIIEKWALKNKHTFNIVKPYRGETVSNEDDFDFLIVMGGPQSASKIDEFPYLADEIKFISTAIVNNKKVLGFCLGAQLIGEALGAKTAHSPEKEVGVFPINLTDDSKDDNILLDFPDNFNAIHWHNDMPGLTDNCTVLASSKGCPRQIIKYTGRTYGFQCHLEITLDGIRTMIDAVPEDLKPSTYTQTETELLIQDYEKINTIMLTILDRFAQLDNRLQQQQIDNCFIKKDDINNRIEAWKQFLGAPENHWEKLVYQQTPLYSECGVVYDLENFLYKPDEGFAIVDMRNLAFVEPHYHPDSVTEIYIILQGTACVVIGHQEMYVTSGDTMIIPPNTAHFVIPDNECVIAVINIPPYKPEHYIPLTLSKNNSTVDFDCEQFQRLVGDMRIRELYPMEATSTVMQQAQEIFITYFTDLYKNIPIDILGIHNLDEYLKTIFEKTKVALLQKEVRMFLIYMHGYPAGFAVCNISEDLQTVLIRTLPVALSYKNQEHVIRQHLLAHIQKKFSHATNAIMLVRKANEAYRSFCENAGFIKNNTLFTKSEYLQKTYDNNWYDIYAYNLIKPCTQNK